MKGDNLLYNINKFGGLSMKDAIPFAVIIWLNICFSRSIRVTGGNFYRSNYCWINIHTRINYINAGLRKDIQ